MTTVTTVTQETPKAGEQNQNSQLWPRRETKREKAKDVKEIESNDLAHASKALDSMIGPCLMVCPAP